MMAKALTWNSRTDEVTNVGPGVVTEGSVEAPRREVVSFCICGKDGNHIAEHRGNERHLGD